MHRSKEPGRECQSLFAGWLERRGSGAAEEFGELCAAHPECAAEFHEFLARLGRLGELLGGGTTLSPAPAGREKSAPFDDLLARLARHRPAESRYEERDELGQGGMGKVLEVYDVDLRRSLAKKVMLADRARAEGTPASDPSLLGRFVEEAQITAQLGHPGVVPVHELGLDEEGRLYFTMERVGGRTLKQVFQLARKGAEGWTLARAVGVLVRVCETLAYAHSKGVIHRDLKPSNVMVGEFGEVYVMDWGLAKLVGAPESSGATAAVETDRGDISDRDPFAGLRTETGAAAGTPGYMAPEQARGEVHALDPRSDVWALGALLYELLAAARPYAPELAAKALAPLYAAMQANRFAPLGEIAPDAPPELVSVSAKAMRTDPAQRYASAEALATDLRAWLEGRVVPAHEQGAWAELRKWVGRNKGLSASLAAVFLVLVGGAVVAAVIEHNGRLGIERQRRVAQVNAGPTTIEGLWAQMEEYWPATPERVPDLTRWIAQADALLDERPLFEDALASLSGGASSFDAGDIDAELSVPLEDLQKRLGELPGRRERMAERLAMASMLEERTVSGEDARARWQVVAAEPIYADLELTPQLGLLPLRADPESGLWEFWHVLSGDEPEIDPATDRYVIDETMGIVLVLVPPGPAQIGAPNVSPSDPLFDNNAELDNYSPEGGTGEVELDAFFISKYELTRAQRERAEPDVYANPVDGDRLHPADLLSWFGAQKVLRRLDLELPTEAQWEAAGRGGTFTRFHTGMTRDTLKGHVCLMPDGNDDLEPDRTAEERFAVFDHDWQGYHERVGSFEPNRFGLHDVHGNVWEWCLDAFDETTPPRPGDGLRLLEGGSGERVYRGGGFRTTCGYARVTYRDKWQPSNSDHDTGVRPSRPIR